MCIGTLLAKEVDNGEETSEQTTYVYTVNQSSGFNIYEGEILIKCHHKWRYMECNSDNGMQTENGSERKS